MKENCEDFSFQIKALMSGKQHFEVYFKITKFEDPKALSQILSR